MGSRTDSSLGSDQNVWCRDQLAEAQEVSSGLAGQQEGAEELVRALRFELHSLRQDTNTVAANARQTVSEKEAVQVQPGVMYYRTHLSIAGIGLVCCLSETHLMRQSGTDGLAPQPDWAR